MLPLASLYQTPFVGGAWSRGVLTLRDTQTLYRKPFPLRGRSYDLKV